MTSSVLSTSSLLVEFLTSQFTLPKHNKFSSINSPNLLLPVRTYAKHVPQPQSADEASDISLQTIPSISNVLTSVKLLITLTLLLILIHLPLRLSISTLSLVLTPHNYITFPASTTHTTSSRWVNNLLRTLTFFTHIPLFPFLHINTLLFNLNRLLSTLFCTKLFLLFIILPPLYLPLEFFHLRFLLLSKKNNPFNYDPYAFLHPGFHIYTQTSCSPPLSPIS